MARAINPMSRPSMSICRESGVASAMTRWESPAILPNSVSIPVATTTPRPRPLTTVVPEKTMLFRSARGVPAGSRPGALSTGTDSPVSAASSTWSDVASVSERSAGTRSPISRTTISPGTTAEASISFCTPSRMTTARWTSIFLSASMASPACHSWVYPRRAFKRTMMRMAAASCGSPTRNETTAAAIRMPMRMPLNCRRKT